jgi:hypothetical protein
MEKPNDGLPLQNKNMATSFRNNSRSENMAHLILVDKSKTYLPPLHTKLGLIKVFVKAVNKESERFGCLR